ncbi:MAG: DUF4124 domain-containing protein [Giesbergeria sp.]|jgi:hypothetical protein|nr:DUF4124 domain-containing protein [Comamonadaceae bacterium]
MKGDPLKRSVLKLLVGSVLAGLCAVVAAQNAPANTQSVYTCVDKQGRKLTSDRPIPECIDREQRELGPTGTVRRVIGPTLTDHERAALEVERRKEQEERNRIADERKRERVLLARYPDKASHDAERALALAQVDAVTATATQRIADLHGRRKTLDLEMEFYRKDPAKAPMMLRRQLAENDEEVQEQRRFIAGQDQEKRRIHQRFDEELAQLRKLWATQRPVPTLPMLVAPTTTAR